VDAWNEAIKAEGFDLMLDPFDLRGDDGYRPAIMKGQETGFMWFLLKVARLEDEDWFKGQIGDADLRADLDTTAPEDEEVAAKIAGAVLAKLTDGYFYDAEADGPFHQGDAAIDVARTAFHEWENRTA
jgi:hypothetical protein